MATDRLHLADKLLQRNQQKQALTLSQLRGQLQQARQHGCQLERYLAEYQTLLMQLTDQSTSVGHWRAVSGFIEQLYPLIAQQQQQVQRLCAIESTLINKMALLQQRRQQLADLQQAQQQAQQQVQAKREQQTLDDLAVQRSHQQP